MNRPPYILIIDDDLEDAEFLISAFTARHPGARFEHCNNGSEGIALLLTLAGSAEACPDMAFLDLHLPGMNGFDTLVKLKQSGKCSNIPIHILSTSLQASEAERCRNAGCADFFSKPMTLEGYDGIVSKSMSDLRQTFNATSS